MDSNSGDVFVILVISRIRSNIEFRGRCLYQKLVPVDVVSLTIRW